MGKRIGGVAYIKVDGDQLELSGKLTCNIMMTEKEGQSGLSGPVGYKETPRVPTIEGDFFVPPGFPMKALESMAEGTVTAELANGMTAVLSGAWLSGTIEVDAAEGTTSLTFEGIEGKWI